MWLYEGRGSKRNPSGAEWIFARLVRMAKWLRIKINPAQTPFEQAQAMSTAMPEREPVLTHVANMYVLERYGRTPADRLEAQTMWRTLRPSLWWTGFKRRIPRSFPRLSTRRFRRIKPGA